MITKIGNALLISLNHRNVGTQIKIDGTGGTGANFLAVKQENGSITGLSEHFHWQGSQEFSGRITSTAQVGSETIVGLSDGRIIKISDAGGTGQNMHAIEQTDYGYKTVPGFSFLRGSHKFQCGISGIYAIGTEFFISLFDGSLLKFNGTGGTGANFLAIGEQDGLTVSVPGFQYFMGKQKFSGRVTSMSAVGNETIIGLSDGRILKIRGTGGTGQNMFAINQTEEGFESLAGYSYLLGSYRFKCSVIGIYSIEGETFIALADGTLVKVRVTGGTGSNFLALIEKDGLLAGIPGYQYWMGTQRFSSSVLSMLNVSGETLIGLSDGRMLKLRDTGGTGQNMFAVTEADHGFDSVEGFSIRLGSQKFSHGVTDICSFGGEMILCLSNASMIKARGTGGTGNNFLAIDQTNETITSLPSHNILLGTQIWDGSLDDYNPNIDLKMYSRKKDNGLSIDIGHPNSNVFHGQDFTAQHFSNGAIYRSNKSGNVIIFRKADGDFSTTQQIGTYYAYNDVSFHQRCIELAVSGIGLEYCRLAGGRNNWSTSIEMMHSMQLTVNSDGTPGVGFESPGPVGGSIQIDINKNVTVCGHVKAGIEVPGFKAGVREGDCVTVSGGNEPLEH